MNLKIRSWGEGEIFLNSFNILKTKHGKLTVDISSVPQYPTKLFEFSEAMHLPRLMDREQSVFSGLTVKYLCSTFHFTGEPGVVIKMAEQQDRSSLHCWDISWKTAALEGHLTYNRLQVFQK